MELKKIWICIIGLLMCLQFPLYIQAEEEFDGEGMCSAYEPYISCEEYLDEEGNFRSKGIKEDDNQASNEKISDEDLFETEDGKYLIKIFVAQEQVYDGYFAEGERLYVYNPKGDIAHEFAIRHAGIIRIDDIPQSSSNVEIAGWNINYSEYLQGYELKPNIVQKELPTPTPTIAPTQQSSFVDTTKNFIKENIKYFIYGLCGLLALIIFAIFRNNFKKKKAQIESSKIDRNENVDKVTGTYLNHATGEKYAVIFNEDTGEFERISEEQLTDEMLDSDEMDEDDEVGSAGEGDEYVIDERKYLEQSREQKQKRVQEYINDNVYDDKGNIKEGYAIRPYGVMALDETVKREKVEVVGKEMLFSPNNRKEVSYEKKDLDRRYDRRDLDNTQEIPIMNEIKEKDMTFKIVDANGEINESIRKELEQNGYRITNLKLENIQDEANEQLKDNDVAMLEKDEKGQLATSHLGKLLKENRKEINMGKYYNIKVGDNYVENIVDEEGRFVISFVKDLSRASQLTGETVMKYKEFFGSKAELLESKTTVEMVTKNDWQI